MTSRDVKSWDRNILRFKNYQTVSRYKSCFRSVQYGNYPHYQFDSVVDDCYGTLPSGFPAVHTLPRGIGDDDVVIIEEDTPSFLGMNLVD